MSTYITRTCGLYGDENIVKQSNFIQEAKTLGILPISLYYYPVDSDDNDQLSSRLDGILSGLSYNNNLILQLPTMLNKRYEQSLINKFNVFRQNSASKLAIILNVMPNLQAMNNEQIEFTIRELNSADILILPNVECGVKLQEKGLSVKHIIYINVWDHQYDKMKVSKFRRCINVLTSKLDQKLIELCNKKKVQLNILGSYGETQRYVKYVGNVPAELHGNIWNHAGGFCLIPYSSVMFPLELTDMIAAGTPILCLKGSQVGDYVEQHGLGYTAPTVDKLIDFVDNSDEDGYREILDHMEILSSLVQKGLMSRQVLSETVQKLHSLNMRSK